MYYQEYVSPIGKMYMTSDGEYLMGLFFDDSRDSFKKALEERKELPIFLETKRWLDIYFKGENPDFTPSYRIENLTPFRKEVLDQIKKIPYGKVVTYGDIAKEIARKKGIKKMSAQAVGHAVGWNPICLIIPCHRVIGINGNLVGYGGGIMHKYQLLQLEKIDMNQYYIPKRGNVL